MLQCCLGTELHSFSSCAGQILRSTYNRFRCCYMRNFLIIATVPGSNVGESHQLKKLKRETRNRARCKYETSRQDFIVCTRNDTSEIYICSHVIPGRRKLLTYLWQLKRRCPAVVTTQASWPKVRTDVLTMHIQLLVVDVGIYCLMY